MGREETLFLLNVLFLLQFCNQLQEGGKYLIFRVSNAGQAWETKYRGLEKPPVTVVVHGCFQKQNLRINFLLGWKNHLKIHGS